MNNSNIRQGLFGILGNNGKVSNLILNGRVSSSATPNADFVGGFVAINYGTIENCTNYAAVSGRCRIGGITGHNAGKVYRCLNEGQINGYQADVGGICGTNGSYGDVGFTIECRNNGSVSSVKSHCGGIAGSNGQGPNLTKGFIVNSYNTGLITSGTGSGGIVGGVGDSFLGAGGVSYIYNCYNRGNTNGGSPIVGVNLRRFNSSTLE